MPGEWAAIQEDIRADALSADACAIAAIVCVGITVASFMLRPDPTLQLAGFATMFGALFLFIFSLHFARKARAAAEDIQRTIDHLAWEEWITTMPTGTRWAVGGYLRTSGPPPPTPPVR